MTRNTEPQLIAPTSMGERERDYLALFLATVQQHAGATAGIIKSYPSTAELLTAADEANGEEIEATILRVAGPIFEADIDLDVDVDGETSIAMRRAIQKADREGISRDGRRLVRMAVFAGEVATWQESSEMLAHVESDGPTAASQGTYQRPELAIAYIDDPLPETA